MQRIIHFRICFATAALLFPAFLGAQALSLDELTALQRKDAAEANDYLSSKGWAFDQAEEETATTYGRGVWAYNKDYDGWEMSRSNSNARAQAWCTIIFSSGSATRVRYQTGNKAHQTSIKNSIKAYGMKTLKSGIEGGEIVSVYAGQKYVVTECIATQNGRPLYQYVVQTKTDYDAAEAATLSALLALLYNDSFSSENNEDSPSPTNSGTSGNTTRYTINGVSFEVAHIPAGAFMMGSNESDDEKPVHRVTVGEFAMMTTEVTQALWRAVMGTNPSYFSGCDQCPVEQVSYEDVKAFITKLNAELKRQGYAVQFRLPTEAEWEYAAKGGEDYTYAGSNNLYEVAWHGGNSGSKTHPVKGKKANGYGLYDMNGNVWEWCEDWYKGYPGSSGVSNYTGFYRVLRGGSWDNNADVCRVANRGNAAPGNRGYGIGFRVVCGL